MLRTAHADHDSRANRLAALRKRHEELSDKLDHVQKQPAISDFYVVELKRQKLKIKDAIAQLMRPGEGEAAMA